MQCKKQLKAICVSEPLSTAINGMCLTKANKLAGKLSNQTLLTKNLLANQKREYSKQKW